MILSIVTIILVGLIAYFHYLQGLLSGLISAVLALVAAAVAITFYEPLAEMLSGGKFNDTAQGICLIALFAIVYLIGRLLFDKLVPGNIRLPHIVDGIGGALGGLIGGLFAMGIVAIALQTMPFGPSIAGYTRYPLASEREKVLSIPGGENNRQVDRTIIDQLKNDNIDKDSQSLLIPVDDLVLGFARHQSNGGALASDKPFASVHPDLLQELFGQRIGIETGAKHTASNAKGTQVEATQINVLRQPPVKAVGEFTQIWGEAPKGTLTPEAGHALITVTLLFKSDASDDDHIVRLSPGSVRLCYKSGEEWKNAYPIGTFQDSRAWLNKVDDFLFIDTSKEDHGVHFLFDVDESLAPNPPAAASAKGGAPAASDVRLPEGTFIEVKRMAKLPLDGTPVAFGAPSNDKKYYPMRKTAFEKPGATADTGQAAQPQASTPQGGGNLLDRTREGVNRRNEQINNPNPTNPATPTAGADNGWNAAPLEKPAVLPVNMLPNPISAGTADADGVLATTAASGHFTARQFDSLEVDASNDGATVAELGKGESQISQLMVPQGKRMVQVKLSVKAGADPWAWAATLGDYAVADAAGATYKPNGVWAAVTAANGAQKLLINYKATAPVPSVNKAEGKLTNVTFIYLLPSDQKAKELQYQGKPGGLPLEN